MRADNTRKSISVNDLLCFATFANHEVWDTTSHFLSSRIESVDTILDVRKVINIDDIKDETSSTTENTGLGIPNETARTHTNTRT